MDINLCIVGMSLVLLLNKNQHSALLALMIRSHPWARLTTASSQLSNSVVNPNCWS